MNRHVSTTRRCVLPTILAAIISGCATPFDPPTAPSVSSDRFGAFASRVGSESLARGAAFSLTGRFYPLQLGNHWHYRKQQVYAVIPLEGDASPPYELNATIDRELICVEHRDGRDYVVEQAEEQDPYQTYRSWVRFRQDPTGLYEADVPTLEPPPCVVAKLSTSSGHRGEPSAGLARRMDELIPVGSPARHAAFRAAVERLSAKLAIIDVALRRMTGASSQTTGLGISGPAELTRLRYPLHPGARWTIRDEPGATFVATVEGTDVLDLPPGRLRGYRIRISSDFLGPDDEVRAWYGPSGYLQLVAHIESDATDVFGEIYGRAVADLRETLEAVRLPGRAFTWPPGVGGLLGR